MNAAEKLAFLKAAANQAALEDSLTPPRPRTAREAVA